MSIRKATFMRPPYRCLYSAHFETAFVKITTDEGLVGWGEALAPVAPEVVSTIVEQLLAPRAGRAQSAGRGGVVGHYVRLDA